MNLQRVLGVVASCAVLGTAEASAQERLCDASRENCRVPLVDLIDHEDVGIDVGLWFIKDARIPAAIIRARNRGVPVRMIMDTRAYVNYPSTQQYITDMAAAGVQMRRRTAGDICHWKLMIFSRQNVVEWSGANYSPIAFVPNTPYRDYEDEVIYFSQQLAPSFKKTFDDIWTNTTEYADHANITRPLVRKYPIYAVDARLNFPPRDSYQDRLVPLIDNEPPNGLIDVDMYRLTLSRPVSAIIRAAARGVRVRMYLEPEEYTNPDRPGNKTQMDRLVAAAQTYPGTIEIRMRKHLGLNHQKTIWLHSQRVVVFGTSNWSDASDDNQLEANFFTDGKAPRDALGELVFTELNKIFERKFYNEAPDGSIETVAWRTPSLPRPDLPGSDTCNDPGANNYGGPAPCTYDPPPPESDAPTVVLWASKTSSSDLHGNWQMVTDSTAAGGGALANPNLAQAKISPAFTAPPNYFEATFSARAGTPYHLWVRMRAENNSMSNDSVHLQFNDSVTSTSAATMRIGTTSSAEVVLQDGSGDSSVTGWGWADNGWGVPGVDIYFQSTGTHTVRVQQREDGAIIDQIVLSPNLYRTAAPGPRDSDNTILPATEAGDPGGTLPSGWQTANIGAASGGSASASGDVFTVTGGGADIWGTADAFRYVYQPLAADGVIVARVASVQNVNAWTKAGVMIRQTLTAGSVHAALVVTPANGLAFQSRATTGGTTVSTAVAGTAPKWVRLVRAGQVVTASMSSDGTSWTDVGQQTIPLSGSVYAGLAVTSHSTSQLATATFDDVSVTASAPSTCTDPAANNYGGPAPCTYDPPDTLPADWQTANIGATSGGSASASGGVFTVTGGGADIWGTADAFRYAYQPLPEDGVVVARVTSVQNVNAWTKAGIMIRQTLTAGSIHASLFVSPANGVAFQSRATTGGTSVSAAVAGAPPQWVRLVRAGQTVTASVSSDGSSWTDVGQRAIPFSGSVYVGLAVTSHSTSQLATATFDGVSVTASAPSTCTDPAANNYGGPAPCTYDPPDTLPTDWQTANVGATAGGSASASGGVFTVTGGGADIWGTADAFRYVYQPLAADGVVVARVTSVENVNAWTKGGVMIRQTLTAGSIHASLFVSPANGLAFQSRATTGGTSVSAAVPGGAPQWVRLVRAGQTVTASVSSDGTSWTDVGQRTIPFSGSVYVGLAVTSHSTSQLASATFESVSITPQP